MKTRPVLCLLLLFIIVNPSFAIKEVVTNYNLRLYGFIVSTKGTSLTLKQVDQKEIEVLKTEVKEINDVESEITFSDGNRFKTVITNITEEEIEFMTGSGTKKLSMSSIMKIDHLSGKTNLENYGMLGVSFITPGGINLVLGRHFENFGLRGTVGLLFFSQFYAGQLNFLINFSKSEKFEHNISFGGGVIDNQLVSSPYYGIFYDLNASGFFLEGGVAIASEIDTPQIMLQLGYVHRFLD